MMEGGVVEVCPRGGGYGGVCWCRKRVWMMTFISEMRKGGKGGWQDWVRGVVVMKEGGGRQRRRGRGRGRKKLLRLAPIKAGGGGQRGFFPPVVARTPGSGSDRRVVHASEEGGGGAGVYAPARIVAGPIRQRFPGTRRGRGRRPSRLVKQHPATLKQYQRRVSRRGDHSVIKGNKEKHPPKKREPKEIKCNEE